MTTKTKPIAEEKEKDVDQEVALSTVRVLLLGTFLLGVGAVGFYYLPGMIKDDADGSRFVNSIYCSAITLTT